MTFLRHLEERPKICKGIFVLTMSEILRKIFCFLRDYFFLENTCALSYA